MSPRTTTPATEAPAATTAPTTKAATRAAPSRAAKKKAAPKRSAAPEPAPVTGHVALVGAGPGDAGLMTRRGAELLGLADVVVLDRLANADLLALARPDVEVLNGGKASHGDSAKQEQINDWLVDRAAAGRRVVRLKGGDPFVFGRGGEEAIACRTAGVPFEVVPGVTSAFSVPAYAGIPVTHRGLSQDVQVISAHLDPGTDASTVDWAGAAQGGHTLVLLMATATIGKVATRLVEHGRSGDTPVAVTQWGTTPEQRTVVSTLDTVEADVAAAGLGAPAVVVVGEVVNLRDELSWFESRPLFGWRVLVPRTRAQAGSASTRLRELGAVPVEVPTIAVEPPRSPAAMERAVKGITDGRFQWIVFTSTNAVRAVREKLEEFGLDARALAGVRIGAIGDSTAAVLADFGVRADLLPAGEQSSAGMIADFPPYDPAHDLVGRVLLPRADIATETLVEGLSGLGWEVEDVTAYRTVRAAPPSAEIREALKGGGFDAVLFTSSSTVKNLVGIAGKPHAETVLACIGPKTCETAQDNGLDVAVQPGCASVDALIDALADHAAARRLTQPLTPSAMVAARKAKRPAARRKS